MESAQGVNHPQPSSSGFENEPVSRSGSIDSVHFFIKSANDTQMEVTANLSEKIQDIKRRHFAAELSQNKRVRLIFLGHELENDTATLRDCGIFNDCVVHIVINSSQPSGEISNEEPSTDPRNEREIGGRPRLSDSVFLKTMGIIFISLWLMYFGVGKQLFTHVYVLCLGYVTLFFTVITICAVRIFIIVILLDSEYYYISAQRVPRTLLISLTTLNIIIILGLIIVATIDYLLYNLWSIYFTTEQMNFTDSSTITLIILLFFVYSIIHFFRFLRTIE